MLEGRHEHRGQSNRSRQRDDSGSCTSFGKLVMRSGLKKEMRRRKFYEKPSDIKRRARLRAERRAQKSRLS